LLSHAAGQDDMPKSREQAVEMRHAGDAIRRKSITDHEVGGGPTELLNGRWITRDSHGGEVVLL
jgi:hypothetical protein